MIYGILAFFIFALFIGYVFTCLLSDFQENAETKKQYLKGLFIPFYWWGVFLKEIIKNSIQDYKDLS